MDSRPFTCPTCGHDMNKLTADLYQCPMGVFDFRPSTRPGLWVQAPPEGSTHTVHSFLWTYEELETLAREAGQLVGAAR